MPYGAGTTIHATQKAGTTAVLETTGTNPTTLDTCTTSTIHGETSNAGSSTTTVSGSIGILSWGVAGTTPCSKTTDTLNAGELEIHWISGTDNGTLTGKNAEVTVNTIFGTCVYGTGASFDLGTLVGGTSPTISIDATVPKISGNFACPGEATWTAEYEVTEPHALYVSTS